MSGDPSGNDDFSVMEDEKDWETILGDNPGWVTVGAAGAFSRAVALTLASFHLTVPRREQDVPRLLGILRDLLVQIEEDPAFAPERDRQDLRWMRRCLEETLKSPSIRLLAPLDGPPH